IGVALVENGVMVGAWAPCGRVERTLSRAVERLWRAAVGSVPSLKVTVTKEEPELEVALHVSNTDTPCSELTTGRVTSWSTTVGDAPGSATTTSKVGTETLGTRSC